MEGLRVTVYITGARLKPLLFQRHFARLRVIIDVPRHLADVVLRDELLQALGLAALGGREITHRLVHFAQAALNGEKPSPSIEDGVKCMEIVDLIEAAEGA